MITIGIPKITKKNRRARLSCEVEINSEVKELWVEVDNKYAGYLTKDRCDAFLIALLPIAMRNQKDLYCIAPVSEELLMNLKTILIPTLAKNGSDLYKTRISVDEIKKPMGNGGAVGTGLSRGISSMHILSNFIDSEYKSIDVTHLLITDIGAYDIAGFGEGGKDAEKIKQECIDESIKMAEELDLDAIKVTSNLTKDFPSKYSLDHIFNNLFPVFALQKMFKIYYYGSSGNSYEKFTLENCDHTDCGSYELLIAAALSTSNLRIILEGGEKNRLEKIADIVHYSPAQKHLHVCITDSKNCNLCRKCMRTLLSLDVLGRLDYFTQVFDIEYYKRNRRKYIAFLEKGHEQGDKLSEPIYQIFQQKKMLPASTPDIVDDSINFYDEINTSALIVKNHTTGKILMKKQPTESFSAVGVAKIMTALIALESWKTQTLIDLPEEFLDGIPRVTLYDVINILMISRSNDAANIIAEAVAGSTENFVNLMNEKNIELKLKNTHYELPTGLGVNSYTTAEDTVKLMEYSFKNPHFCKIFKSLSYTIKSNGNEKSIKTSTPLLMPASRYYIPECIAAKYGTAGLFGNVIAVTEKNANVYLAVLLGVKEEDKTQNKFRDAKNILHAVMNPKV